MDLVFSFYLTNTVWQTSLQEIVVCRSWIYCFHKHCILGVSRLWFVDVYDGFPLKFITKESWLEVRGEWFTSDCSLCILDLIFIFQKHCVTDFTSGNCRSAFLDIFFSVSRLWFVDVFYGFPLKYSTKESWLEVKLKVVDLGFMNKNDKHGVERFHFRRLFVVDLGLFFSQTRCDQVSSGGKVRVVYSLRFSFLGWCLDFPQTILRQHHILVWD